MTDILTPEQVKLFRTYRGLSERQFQKIVYGWEKVQAIKALCDSHEALRAELDSWKKATVKATVCHAGRDGDCYWELCPQIRDNEPNNRERTCPLREESEDT